MCEEPIKPQTVNLTCGSCGYYGETEISSELQGLIDSEDEDGMFGQEIKCSKCDVVLTIDVVTITERR